MASDYDPANSEEDFEEDGDEQTSIFCFGTEPNRSYSGEKMEQLDETYASDTDDGHLIFPPDFVLSHRYQIKTMIGRGTFCLVWLAYDYLRCENVAIKVLKKNDDDQYSDCQFEDEYVINNYLSQLAGKDEHLTLFYDVFYHESHFCFVFELVSQNILTFLNYFDDQYVGIPIPLVKKIALDTLKGLDFMHRNGVIHTDLKPENVLADRPIFPYEPFSADDNREVFNCLEDDPSSVTFKLLDLGNSCFADDPINDLIQTRQYRSPEVLLGIPYDSSADIWSLACMTFELATRHHLFDPTLNDKKIEEDSKNRTLFDSVHLSMIEQVVGPIPRDWARNGLNYHHLYDAKGNFVYKYRKELPCVYDLLVKLGVSEGDAEELADFLEPMLSIIPKQRPTAADLIESPWFHSM